VPIEQKGEEWNRGAYLAEALSDCTGCHTPRNALGAEETQKADAGAVGEITMRMRRFIANPDRNFVAIIKNGTIYKNTLQQAMVQFGAIDRSVDLAGFMR
jgi:mono/diheme cytochrome c family protein